MKFEVNVVSKQELELSEEDCENILIQTLHIDWYDIFQSSMDKEDGDAIKRVYNIYSGKNLV
jgi:hypothetical protein